MRFPRLIPAVKPLLPETFPLSAHTPALPSPRIGETAERAAEGFAALFTGCGLSVGRRSRVWRMESMLSTAVVLRSFFIRQTDARLRIEEVHDLARKGDAEFLAAGGFFAFIERLTVVTCKENTK